MLDDVNLCTEEELSLDGPCAEAAAALVDGMEIEVLVVDESGCEFATVVSWIASSISEHDQAFHAWPNPANGTVYISGIQHGAIATLHSMTGQIIAS